MVLLGDAALPPMEKAFSLLFSKEILLPLCLIAIVAAVTAVLVVVLVKRKKKGNG